MKSIKFFFVLFLMCIITLPTYAQNNATETALKQMFADVTNAFNSGDFEKGFSYYTDKSFEIGPDGRMTTGKKALIESWNMFLKMLDSKPVFTYSNQTIHSIAPDFAIISFDAESDLKMKGQQIGGKLKGIAILHKINGKWMCEGDVVAPVMQMPNPQAAEMTDIDVLKSVHDKAMAAFSSQDVNSLVSLFAEDGVHISPTGNIVKGKEAIKQSYINLFKRFSAQPKPDRVTHEMSDVTGQFLSPDTYLTNYYEKSTFYFGSKSQVMEEANSVLLVKKGNDWLIKNITVTMKGDMPTAVAKN